MDTGDVAEAAGRTDPRLAGREFEQGVLARALEGAASARPCAVVIHGEAGVGKTRLVREVTERLGDDTVVLWGTCVHFGEATVPFAPVIGALQSWLALADDAVRAEVLAGVGELGSLLPGLGKERTSDPGRLLPLIDLLVDRIAERARAVIVIDDLQWADRTSLDVLAYLVTGFRQRRLALLATCREEHRGEGHPLHGWLADLRRLPHFSELHLDRLDLSATETQIRGLLGRPVDLGLAAEVQERSGGNPYLTELLVRDLTGAESRLPATAPAVLRDALLASWHGLSPVTRQVTRILAVGGRPTPPAVLEGVAVAHGIDPDALARCLTEAEEGGVVRADGQGRLWLRHPLLAEVLYGGLRPPDKARIHATYVEVLEALFGDLRGRMAADVALHNHLAGRVDAAYSWSLVAAGHAASLRASAEEGLHLERAASLWEQVSPAVRGPAAGHVELLRRLTNTWRRTGRLDAALVQADRALSLVDRDREPLLAGALLVERTQVSWQLATRGTAVVPELIEAVEVTEPFPDSPERALALAALAWAEGWDSAPDAARHAEQAVTAARNSGSAVALGWALATRANPRGGALNPAALADAEEAERLARSAGDDVLRGHAAVWRVNRLRERGRIAEAVAVAHEAYRDLLAVGAPQPAYFLAALAADGMLHLGRWQECRELLRSALAARCTALVAGSVRLAAARLAVRTGRLGEAEQHLGRVLELVAEEFPGIHPELSLAGAEVYLATAPPKALDWLSRRLTKRAVVLEPVEEEVLVALTGAAATVAQRARDAGDGEGAARAAAVVEDTINRLPQAPFSIAGPDVDQQRLRAARFAAELARCRNAPDQAARWQDVIDSAEQAGAPWDEAVACRRRAEALIATGAPGSVVGEGLRRAHRLAVGLGAVPLRDDVAALARIARIDLSEPLPVATIAGSPLPAGLTAREREILGLLVAGRSNGDIARQLVISTKTVSVHVSNILRKTGTSSRLEVAALAERLAVDPDS